MEAEAMVFDLNWFQIPEPFKSFIKASAELQFNKPDITISKFLIELEKATTAKEWSVVHGSRPTVIVVDEANGLKQMENQNVKM